MLSDLITMLNDHGVQVVWARELDEPGVWVRTHGLLVLSATASATALAGSCREVLGYVRRTDRLPRL